MVLPQPPNHVLGLHDSAGLAMSPIVGRPHEPQVLRTGQRLRAILGSHAEHLARTLREHAENRRWLTIGADDEVAHVEITDPTPAPGCQHPPIDRLRTTAHECEGGNLYGAALEELGGVVGADHVVERVPQGSQVGVDLGHQVAGQEPEPLAGLHRRAREDDAVDLLGHQRLHRHRHGEPALAGAGRTDAEGDHVLAAWRPRSASARSTSGARDAREGGAAPRC